MFCLFVDFFRFNSLIIKGVSSTGYFNEQDRISTTLQQNPAKQDDSKSSIELDELNTLPTNRKRIMNTAESTISNNHTENVNRLFGMDFCMEIGFNSTKIVIRHSTAVFVIVVSITFILVVGYIFKNLNIF